MPSVVDKFLALDKLLKGLRYPRTLIMVLAVALVLLMIASKPYATTLDASGQRHAAIYLALFFLPATICGVIQAWKKGTRGEVLLVAGLVVMLTAAVCIPLRSFYFIANGKFDSSPASSLSGQVTAVGCNGLRTKECWIEFSAADGKWQIAPVSGQLPTVGTAIIVTYKHGFLGKPWVSHYQIRGAST